MPATLTPEIGRFLKHVGTYIVRFQGYSVNWALERFWIGAQFCHGKWGGGEQLKILNLTTKKNFCILQYFANVLPIMQHLNRGLLKKIIKSGSKSGG